MRPEKEKQKFIKAVGAYAHYFLFYFLALAGLELFMRVVTVGAVRVHHVSILFLLPSFAAFFAALNGFSSVKRNLNRVILCIITAVICFYYMAQFFYFRIFGSVFSVSLAAMGTEAMGDFGWTTGDIIKVSFGIALLCFVPLAAAVVFSVIPKGEKAAFLRLGNGYRWSVRLLGLCLCAVFWIGGVFGLKLMGTGRDSAYAVMRSSYSDTDTTSDRIGILATGALESASLFFDIRQDTEEPKFVVTDSPKAEGTDVSLPVTEGDGTVNPPAEEQEKTPTYYLDPNFDFASLAESTDQKDVKDLCGYFGALAPEKTNEYTGLFKDYNLIMICAESFSTYGIHPDITPTLWDMAGNGIVLDNFYNSFPNTTTNGEFAFVAGLWPDVSRSAKLGSSVGSFAQSAARYMPYAPGVLFDKAGYDTYAYHNYKGYYYRRKYTYPNLGYENLKFMGEGMTFTTSWPSSDLEMFEQSVDDYINSDTPFHAYYMTFSGHGPYTDANCIYRQNIDEVTAMTEGLYKVSYTLGYYCGELELERAVKYLKERLTEAGKLDKTVIVIVGDHYPYYLMKGAVREIMGGTMPDENFEKFKSTCVIYCGGIKEPIHVDEYCCNVDILPTLYNLFDIPFDSRLLPGTDVFS
ncbi:MAG: sulfatase-like hydrolase/transferase, partial [Lachnospiraceae bacterium]|nr:sulfatase-like hydrolase/transferase [Lachnospiraceae bacterium]